MGNVWVGMESFMEITGADASTATHFIEAFGGNLDAAVTNYMASLDEAQGPPQPASAEQEAAGTQESLRRDIENIRKDLAVLTSPLEQALETVAEEAEKEAAITCVTTCGKYMGNIVAHPLDPKFHTIKLENKAFLSRVNAVPGGKALLLAVGFVEKEETLFLEAPDLEKLRSGAERMQEAARALAEGVGTSFLTGKLHHPPSDGDFSSLMERAGSRLVVVDFFADWCGPCRQIAPAFEALTSEYPDVVFAKIDTQKELECSKEVRSLPTFRLYRGGQVIDEMSGADIQGLKVKIQSHS